LKAARLGGVETLVGGDALLGEGSHSRQAAVFREVRATRDAHHAFFTGVGTLVGVSACRKHGKQSERKEP
jgi:hypothetical protein